MAEPQGWPFLVALMREAVPGEAPSSEWEPPSPLGLGWLVGDYLVTLASLGGAADTVVTDLEGRNVRVEFVSRGDRFALFRVEDEETRRRAASLAQTRLDASCSAAEAI